MSNKKEFDLWGLNDFEFLSFFLYQSAPWIVSPIYDHMVEWSKATVCKTDWRNPHGGSNPSMVTKNKNWEVRSYAVIIESILQRKSSKWATEGCRWVTMVASGHSVSIICFDELVEGKQLKKTFISKVHGGSNRDEWVVLDIKQ